MREPLTTIEAGGEETIPHHHRLLIAAAAVAVLGAGARVLAVREVAEPDRRGGWTGRQRVLVAAARKPARPRVEVKTRVRAPRRRKPGETPNHA
jgi:hypothetical protein